MSLTSYQRGLARIVDADPTLFANSDDSLATQKAVKAYADALSSGGGQPLDATLTALAALVIAANSLTVGSGADAFTQTTFDANTFPARSSSGNLVAKTITDFALTILDDSNAATARATLGAGTSSFSGAFSALSGIPTTISGYGITDAYTKTASDARYDSAGAASSVLVTAEAYTDSGLAGKQPLDSELTALAGLTSAADKLPYFIGSGTAALTTLSAFVRTVLDDADAATFRTTIGAGTSSFGGAYGSLTGIPSTFAPSAHASSHNSGGSDALAADAAAATPSLRSLGSTSTTACAGNDSRLSDTRTPTAHASTHLPGGTDPLVSLPVGEYTLTVSQTIGSTQKSVLWGTLTITAGTLTINGKLLVLAEPYGV